MTYLIMQLLPTFPRSQKKVATLARIFPTAYFLHTTYGLQPEDRILVRHTRQSTSRYRRPGYRTAFKHVFKGTLAEFESYCRDRYAKVWARNKGEVD